MPRLQHIEIDGKRYLWRELLQLRREQKKAQARAQQPALFELRRIAAPLPTARLRAATGNHRSLVHRRTKGELW
jgi:hypothetical protein